MEREAAAVAAVTARDWQGYTGSAHYLLAVVVEVAAAVAIAADAGLEERTAPGSAGERAAGSRLVTVLAVKLGEQ